MELLGSPESVMLLVASGGREVIIWADRGFLKSDRLEGFCPQRWGDDRKLTWWGENGHQCVKELAERCFVTG